MFLQGILGKETVVNMAAALGKVLSFSKNAKVLVSPLRLSAVPAHRYSLEVSSTGEAITHTGQVSIIGSSPEFSDTENTERVDVG